MGEAAVTLDGWYCLHDFRSIDWTIWKMLSNDERQAAISEFWRWLKSGIKLKLRKKEAMHFIQLLDKKQIL